MKAITDTLAQFVTGLASLGVMTALVSASDRAPNDGRRPEGIAARYVGDRGIAKDSDVIFADNFESWGSSTESRPGSWRVRKNNVSRTRVIRGKVSGDTAGMGRNILEIACWTTGSGSQTGGLSLKLGNYNHANEGQFIQQGNEPCIAFHLAFRCSLL